MITDIPKLQVSIADLNSDLREYSEYTNNELYLLKQILLELKELRLLMETKHDF